MEYYTYYLSPLGKLLITADETCLTGIWFQDRKAPPTYGVFREMHPVFLQAHKWLDAYFAGEPCDTQALPLNPKGTQFQMLVWRLLLDIPWGESSTYGQLAKQAAEILGKKHMSPQAVGNAVGKNPISIVIPCHRVLGSGGRLTGYAGGLDRKRFLLDLERIQYK